MLPKPVNGTIPIAVAGSAQQSPQWLAKNVDATLNYPRELGALRFKIHEWQRLTVDSPKPYLAPLQLDLQSDPRARPEKIREGPCTGRSALIRLLQDQQDPQETGPATKSDARQELGVAHVTPNLRQGNRPAEDVMRELAEEVLPYFPAR